MANRYKATRIDKYTTLARKVAPKWVTDIHNKATRGRSTTMRRTGPCMTYTARGHQTPIWDENRPPGSRPCAAGFACRFQQMGRPVQCSWDGSQGGGAGTFGATRH